jgi:hypothetical protein
MARIDSLLAIVVDQGANELRLGSDREPKMFAHGTPKKLHLPMMPEQTIRELLGDILSTPRAASLAARRPVEVTHEAGALGTFQVTLTLREGGGLDVLFLRATKRSATVEATTPPALTSTSPAPVAAIDAAGTMPAPAPEVERVSVARNVRPIVVGLGAPLVSLIARAASMNASDLHVLDGEPPAVRVGGVLSPLDDQPAIRIDEALMSPGNLRIAASTSTTLRGSGSTCMPPRPVSRPRFACCRARPRPSPRCSSRWRSMISPSLRTVSYSFPVPLAPGNRRRSPRSRRRRSVGGPSCS